MRHSLRVLLALFPFITVPFVTAQIQLPASVTSFKTLGNGLEVTAGRIQLRVTALAPTVVRLRYSASGSNAVDDPFAVLPDAFPGQVKLQVNDATDAITCNTGVLQIRISKKPLRVSFLDLNGNVISQDTSVDPV